MNEEPEILPEMSLKDEELKLKELKDAKEAVQSEYGEQVIYNWIGDLFDMIFSFMAKRYESIDPELSKKILLTQKDKNMLNIAFSPLFERRAEKVGLSSDEMLMLGTAVIVIAPRILIIAGSELKLQKEKQKKQNKKQENQEKQAEKQNENGGIKNE
jgi:hypothetical protein